MSNDHECFLLSLTHGPWDPAHGYRRFFVSSVVCLSAIWLFSSSRPARPSVKAPMQTHPKTKGRFQYCQLADSPTLAPYRPEPVQTGPGVLLAVDNLLHEK